MNSYKTASVTRESTEVFLSTCWTNAVIEELQRLNYLNDLNWDSIDLKENIKIESDDE